MKINERERQILSILKEQRFAGVNELSKKLYVSPSSIRRDLNRLENAGIVERNYGGVVLTGDLHRAAPFIIRSEQNLALKRDICEKASALLKDNMSVMLDDSSTAFHMLSQMTRFNNIAVFTNNLTTASRAVELSLKVYMIGGTSSHNSVTMCGSYALDMLDNIYADMCFVSSFAIADDGQVYDCTEEANEVRKKMLNRCKERVLLCDSTKFGTYAAHRLCHVKDLDYVFSDKPLPESMFKG